MRVMSNCRPTFLLFGFTLLAFSSNLEAQLGQHDVCYRFDRSYFNWVGRPPGGGQVFVDSTAVVRLSSSKHSELTDAYTLVPPSMVADSFTENDWLRPSSWRFFAPDSIYVVWYNRLYGPVFRLGIRGDTLIGQVRFTTDQIGREPPPERAFAVRIECSPARR